MPEGGVMTMSIELDETAVCDNCGAVYFLVAGHSCGSSPLRNLPVGEREWRAREADRERGEATLTLASGNHKLGTSPCCPLCKGPVVVGETVRVVHAASCARRAAIEKTRKAVAEGKTVRRLVPVQVRPAGPETAPAPRAVEQPKTTAFGHASRYPHQRDRDWTKPVNTVTRPPRRRIRTSVVRSWQLRGSKVRVGGYAATVTGPVRQADEHNTLLVPVAFDDGWEPENVRITVDNRELVTELAACA